MTSASTVSNRALVCEAGEDIADGVQRCAIAFTEKCLYVVQTFRSAVEQA